MAKETNFKHPPKGHVGLLAYDSGNDRFQVVYVDATGNLQVDVVGSLPAGTANIGDVDVLTMPTTTVQSKDGDKVLAFESIVEEKKLNSSLSTDVNTLNGTAVGSGKIWKITQASIWYDGTVPDNIQIIAQGLATDMYLLFQLSPASGMRYMWTGEIYLQVNDYMSAVVVGATATDSLAFNYAGVEMNAP